VEVLVAGVVYATGVVGTTEVVVSQAEDSLEPQLPP
jgi:hypothetical protein